MAPKGKGGDKSGSKGKDSNAGGDKKGAQKGAQSINVRHILCAKHGKKEDALKKLNEGVAFNKVAEEFSEDKARAGMSMFRFHPDDKSTQKYLYVADVTYNRRLPRLENQRCTSARIRESRVRAGGELDE